MRYVLILGLPSVIKVRVGDRFRCCPGCQYPFAEHWPDLEITAAHVGASTVCCGSRFVVETFPFPEGVPRGSGWACP